MANNFGFMPVIEGERYFISYKSLFRISPHASCLHLFRHILPKSSLIHKVLPAVLAASGEKSYGA